MAAVVAGYALGPFIISRKLSDLPGNGVVAASLLVTALVYAPFGLSELPSRVPSDRSIASILALGLVCTAMAFVLFFALIAEVGPVRATIITYVNPAVAVLLGVVLLGERFTASTGVGFVLILGGSVFATGAGRRWFGRRTYTEQVANAGTTDQSTRSAPGSAIVDPGSMPTGHGPTGGTNR
jgi:drug/metabolite transporter (DMT)-like permease